VGTKRAWSLTSRSTSFARAILNIGCIVTSVIAAYTHTTNENGEMDTPLSARGA
jgi:hypothetical protein